MSKKYVGKGLYSGLFGSMDPLRVALSTGKYETRHRLDCGANGVAVASGALCLTPIWLPAGLPVSSITFSSGTAAGATLSHQWFSLSDSTKTQLATTTNDLTTAWASNSTKTLNIANTAAGAASSFTTTYEGVHFLGLMVNASTPPTYTGNTISTAVTNISPTLGGTYAPGAAYTTPLAFPYTQPAATQASGMLYGYVN